MTREDDRRSGPDAQKRPHIEALSGPIFSMIVILMIVASATSNFLADIRTSNGVLFFLTIAAIIVLIFMQISLKSQPTQDLPLYFGDQIYDDTMRPAFIAGIIFFLLAGVFTFVFSILIWFQFLDKIEFPLFNNFLINLFCLPNKKCSSIIFGYYYGFIIYTIFGFSFFLFAIYSVKCRISIFSYLILSNSKLENIFLTRNFIMFSIWFTLSIQHLDYLNYVIIAQGKLHIGRGVYTSSIYPDYYLILFVLVTIISFSTLMFFLITMLVTGKIILYVRRRLR